VVLDFTPSLSTIKEVGVINSVAMIAATVSKQGFELAVSTRDSMNKLFSANFVLGNIAFD